MNFYDKYKWIIFGSIAVILVFVLFALLRDDKSSSSPDGIERTLITTPGVEGVVGNNSDPAAEFIGQLLDIQKIELNIGFFNDPIYKELVDQYRPIDKRPSGRPNPFLEINEAEIRSGNNTGASTGTGNVTVPTSEENSDQGFVQTSTENNSETSGDN